MADSQIGQLRLVQELTSTDDCGNRLRGAYVLKRVLFQHHEIGALSPCHAAEVLPAAHEPGGIDGGGLEALQWRQARLLKKHEFLVQRLGGINVGIERGRVAAGEQRDTGIGSSGN